MKKNVKLVKYALMGMLSFGLVATTFTSCKDYDDDIDNLQEQINKVVSDLNELKTQVGDKGVTSVTFDEATGKLTVVDASGSKTYTVQSGSTTTMPEIKLEGNKLYVGSEVKGTVEAGDKVTVNADGILCVNGEPTDVKIGRSYMIKDDDNKKVTISMLNDKGTVDTVVLPYYSASSALTELELLGWANLAKESDDLSQTTDLKTTDLTINYAWVNKIVKNYDGNKETTWSAQKTVVKHQVLTTLAPTNTKLIARVAPANLDASQFSFTLQNSKGEALPVTLGAAVPYTGLLTKSATSALYAIPMDITDATYNAAADYKNLFKSNAVYSLVEKDGFKSAYTPFTITTTPIAPAAQKVNSVDGKAKTGTTSNNTDIFDVNLNKANALTFTNPEQVYDYYVEAADPTIAGMFGFSADKTAGTFTVTKLADAITTTTFDVYVYALHLDGTIYRSTITIKPLRTLGSEVVYNLGNYTIKNGGKMTVDLSEMFTKLGDDAAIWKNATLGAKSAKVSIVKDEDASATDLYAAGGKLASTAFNYKKADGSAAAINEAAKIEIAPNYQYGTPAAASLEIGKGYTITITFNDNAGATGTDLNTIKVKFTPVIPALSNYIVRKPAVFKDNVLYAYFNDPATTATPTLSSSYDIKQGFTTFGSTAAADLTAITLALDPNQKVEGNTTLVSGTGTMAAIAATTITLNQTTINGTIKQYAYAKELDVKVGATYLGVYTFPEAERNAASFKIKVQSALEAGTIKPAEGASIVMPAAAGGQIWKMTDADIKGYTYNNQVYSLFQTKQSSTANPKYLYTYVQSVKFETVDPTLYTVVDADGNTSTTGEAVAPAWANNKEVASYVAIKPGNISNTTETKIKVTVTDMFGYVKTVDVPLTITVGK